jgi:hypothetical protein
MLGSNFPGADKIKVKGTRQECPLYTAARMFALCSLARWCSKFFAEDVIDVFEGLFEHIVVVQKSKPPPYEKRVGWGTRRRSHCAQDDKTWLSVLD